MQIRISEDVIASIVGKAVSEVEGVVGLSGKGRRRSVRSVSLKIEDGTVAVSLAIVVHGGVKVHVVAQDVQARVKSAIENMTGLLAGEVNVHVAGLVA